MNYEEALIAERSRKQMDRIAKAVGADPKEFRKLVNILYTGKDPLPRYAAWPIEVITRTRPELVKPHIRRFIETVNDFEEDPIRRGIFNALSKQKIPEKLQAKTLDICLENMLSPERTVAVKVFAMEVAFNIVKEHLELAGELKAVIEDQWDKNTVAFRARGKRILSLLAKKVHAEAQRTRRKK
ncbi:MAG: hypothetical protein ACJ77K_04110 [Bacteroidia bacterium]